MKAARGEQAAVVVCSHQIWFIRLKERSCLQSTEVTAEAASADEEAPVSEDLPKIVRVASPNKRFSV